MREGQAPAGPAAPGERAQLSASGVDVVDDDDPLAGDPVEVRDGERPGATAADYRARRAASLAGLRDPAALSRTCRSPLGFDWTVLETTAATFMNTLVHTWDLATTTGQPADLDPDPVEACIEMFLPEMPERRQAAGLVVPSVPMTDDATPKNRPLGAMGRPP